MKTANLDLLEKSELPPAQARAILQVMESELAAHDTALATKADLQALRAELIGKIEGTIRWNFAFWVVQLGAMAAMLKLLK